MFNIHEDIEKEEIIVRNWWEKEEFDEYGEEDENRMRSRKNNEKRKTKIMKTCVTELQIVICFTRT